MLSFEISEYKSQPEAAAPPQQQQQQQQGMCNNDEIVCVCICAYICIYINLYIHMYITNFKWVGIYAHVPTYNALSRKFLYFGGSTRLVFKPVVHTYTYKLWAGCNVCAYLQKYSRKFLQFQGKYMF